MKPFSAYPEDRAKLLALCDKVEKEHGSEFEDAVYALADLVRAILTDEAVVIAAAGKQAPDTDDDDYYRPDASGYSRADEEWFFDADGKP